MEENEIKKMEEQMKVYNEIKDGVVFMRLENDQLLYVKFPDSTTSMKAETIRTKSYLKYLQEGVITEKKLKKVLADTGEWTEEDDKNLVTKLAELNNLYQELEKLQTESKIEDMDSFIANFDEIIKEVEPDSNAYHNRIALRDCAQELLKTTAEFYALKGTKDKLFNGTVEYIAEISRDIFLMVNTIVYLDENEKEYKPYYTIKTLSDIPLEELLAMRTAWQSIIRGCRKSS